VGAERLTARAAAGVLLAALVVAGCDAGTEPPDAAAPEAAGERATVEWVNDGDTLTLADGRKVRLVQVDAPELTTDCYGRAALRVLIGLTPKGTAVMLLRDPELDDRDRHGRLLRYVLVRERNVNVELVRRGAASPYYFRNERGRHADELDDAVEQARRGRAGYWGACPAAELNTGLGSVTGRA
jgi:endonuclease YncB( thermonuclease family)